MSQVVLLKKASEISKMKAHYSGSLNDKQPPGSVFAAKVPGCSITAYKSGKVLFQGSGCEAEAKKWGDTARSAQLSKKTSPAAANLPENISSLSVIGSDEVGTGDYFGPITVVAAYVKKDQIPLLKELGVKDSKNLGDEKIIEIAKQIKDIVPHSLLTLHNEKYNKLQQSGMSQGKIKALLHNQAIGHVLGKISPEKPEAILIDQFAKEEIYFNYLKNQQTIQRERVFFSTKAEGIHLAVAAASILARYAFVHHFENLSTKAGFRLTKGAGPKVDEAAARLIKEKGREALPSFVKLHFANTEKAMKLYSRKYN
ncbi:ribonuclease HIII [Cytobacillus firmus]|uniref:Ribonuclease HIII n=1 Tax=Cytobacillus firmus TaxID=1399 RepID=A0A800MY54_CYTFI|nr:ribonuclease HIII [Cytobacillus firmus]KAF0824445.1 Ribonuclease HIII [Cytobacillus firmus]MBG9546501.1 ribonuclease HIII [Cytobacillus firmus]MBG9603464.1 ribonuclease HIII [Cytobacillus firmus]MDD9310689.1 ribonuclease HIII [Cytobacillus firmus]MED1942866.1 ribonuclease HIII [Cytobacillus firmus]